MQASFSTLARWRDDFLETLRVDEELIMQDLESGGVLVGDTAGPVETDSDSDDDDDNDDDDEEESQQDSDDDDTGANDQEDALDETEALWAAAEDELEVEEDFMTSGMTLYLTYVPGIMVAVMFFISIDQQEKCPEIPLVPWLCIHIANGFLLRPILERWVFRPYEDRTGRRLWCDYALDVLSSGWYFVGCVWFFGGPWQECRVSAPVLTSMMLGLLLYPLILVTIIMVLMCVLPVCCIPCLDIFEFFFIGGEPLAQGVRRRAGKKRRRKGLSGRQLATLVPVPFESAVKGGQIRDGDLACVICLTEYEDEDLVCCLSCAGGHVFHKECADQWLGKRSTCPSCRGKIVVSPTKSHRDESENAAADTDPSESPPHRHDASAPENAHHLV